MKQPELGKKLSDLRKQKDLTQEELVESCNVSVRTIQRIESGEVTPRTSTIKILLAALGEDFDSFKEKLSDQKPNNLEDWFTAAWIAGVMYFILGFVDATFEYIWFEEGNEGLEKSVYIPFKFIYLISFGIFMLGIIKLSELFDNYLLRIAGYIMVGLFTLITMLDTWTLFFELNDYSYLMMGIGESISMGVLGIILGVGLIRLQDGMGQTAKVAGILEIAAGFCFCIVVLFWIGYVLVMPAIILEIILLFKAAEFVRKQANTTNP